MTAIEAKPELNHADQFYTQKKAAMMLVINLHHYQPAREISLLDGKLEVVPWVNEDIHRARYGEFTQSENTFSVGRSSWYGTLREWMKKNHPESIDSLRARVQEIGFPDIDYRILGDPYLHVILPLLPKEDQDMMVKIGKKAIKKDLGVEPKGFWPPETAISSETLEVLIENGYEFVVLRSDQISESYINPSEVVPSADHHYYIETSRGRIAVFPFQKASSGSVAFDQNIEVNGKTQRATANADDYLEWAKLNSPDGVHEIGMDGETLGHHIEGAKYWHDHLVSPTTLAAHNIAPVDTQEVLEKPGKQVYLKEYSSWSCEHDVGRWTGSSACNCDGDRNPIEQDRKREYHLKLTDYNDMLNARLDATHPAWRKDFESLFLSLRDKIYNGEKFADELTPIEGDDEYARDLYAKFCILNGRTSCGWFFASENGQERVERQIPRIMIGEIERVHPDFKERYINNKSTGRNSFC